MNKTNLEFKARLPRELADTLAALLERGYKSTSFFQVDDFLPSQSGYLKARSTNGRLSQIISYSRSRQPRERMSNVRLERVSKGNESAISLIINAIGPIASVRKDRHRLTKPGIIINLDHVEGLGDFIECEIDISAIDRDRAQQILGDVRNLVGVAPYHQISAAYAELLAAKLKAAALRQQLLNDRPETTLFLLDGASGTGKSTARDHVAATFRESISYARRVTTRHPRVNESHYDEEYIYVAEEQFAVEALQGEYLEFRDFDFGMSYGLPLTEIVAGLSARGAALGLMNLGNAEAAKLIWPDAVTIMIISRPDIVESRLRRRGGLTDEQITERVQNAAQAISYADGYDFVVENNSDDVNKFSNEISDLLRAELHIDAK